jgi:hypothetical protein
MKLFAPTHFLLPQTEVDVIEDIDEYQTWPGWLILILRTIIMMWFVYELKDTMDHEHQPHKLNFFLHFGAAALVWFIYLPIVALIALQVSPLWRSKLLLGKTSYVLSVYLCVFPISLPIQTEQGTGTYLLEQLISLSRNHVLCGLLCFCSYDAPPLAYQKSTILSPRVQPRHFSDG